MSNELTHNPGRFDEVIHIIDNAVAELIQFDNPHIILIRDCEICEYPENEVTIDNKKIYKSTIKLQENDIFIAMSDGCPHAGIGRVFNFGLYLIHI